MGDSNRLWAMTRDKLVGDVVALGFPAELGEMVAKNLGSPRAMERMRAYLKNVQPKSAELLVDEMLSICEEISAWRERKEAREANERYNELLYYGLEGDEDGDDEGW